MKTRLDDLATRALNSGDPKLTGEETVSLVLAALVLRELVRTEPTYWTEEGEICVYCGGHDGHLETCPRDTAVMAINWFSEAAA